MAPLTSTEMIYLYDSRNTLDYLRELQERAQYYVDNNLHCPEHIQALKQIKDLIASRQPESLAQKLRKLELQKHLAMANKLADNEYSEACGYTRAYMDSVSSLVSAGLSPAEARDKTVSSWGYTLVDIIIEF